MITVKAETRELERYLTAIERKHLPFVRALSLTKTAQHIQQKTLPAMLPRIFDRPAPFTMRGFYVIPAQKRDLSPEAAVQIKDGVTPLPMGRGGKIGTPAFNYLQPQIQGMPRRAKSHERQLRRMGILGPDEYTVPGENMRLNKFGNLTGATYSKILADVLNLDTRGNDIASGYGQRTTKRGKRRYFYHPNLRPRGIYMRTGTRTLIVALLFVKMPRYQKRFDFQGIGERVARKQFPIEFRKAMAYALRTAR